MCGPLFSSAISEHRGCKVVSTVWGRYLAHILCVDVNDLYFIVLCINYANICQYSSREVVMEIFKLYDNKKNYLSAQQI